MINLPLFVAPCREGAIVLTPHAVHVRGKSVLGLLILGGKCFQPSAPVGGVPKVQKGKKRFADRVGNAVSENKAKTEVETNEPKTGVKKARPVKRFSHFHGGRK